MARTLKVSGEKNLIQDRLIDTGNYQQVWIKTEPNPINPKSNGQVSSEINERIQIQKILMKILNRKTTSGNNIQMKRKRLHNSPVPLSKDCQLSDNYDEKDLIDKCISFCTKCNNRNIRISQKECNRCNIPYIYKCKTCGKQISEQEMLHHIKKECNATSKTNIQKNNNDLYKCASCSQLFQDSTNILEHIKVCQNNKSQNLEMQPERDRGYHIVLVPPSVSEDNDMNTWSDADWTEKIVRYCLTCDQSYKAEEEMDCIAPNEKKCKICQDMMVWKCNPCNRRFRSYTGVFHHLEEYCSYGKLLECTKCKFKTVNSQYLKTHVELMHSNKGLFECKKCNEKFKDLEHLNIHCKICGEAKSIQCKYCLKKFHFREMLKIHLQITHGLIEFNFKDHMIDNENSQNRDNRFDETIDNNPTYDFISSMERLGDLGDFVSDGFDCFTCRSKFKNQDFYESHLNYCEVDHGRQVNSSLETFKTQNQNKKTRGEVIDSIKIKPISEVISAYCLTCKDDRKTHNRFKKCFRCKTALVFCCIKCDSESCYHLDQYMDTLKHECDYCSKGFHNEIAVSNHKKYFHNYSHYECQNCGLQAALKETVDKHIPWCYKQSLKL